MQEKLDKIASLFDKILDLIVEDKFEDLPLTIKEIKDSLRGLGVNTDTAIAKSADEFAELKAKLDALDARVAVLENKKAASTQIAEEVKKSNIWNF